ncbi:VOC family protein [bacterium]|nr:VOC family protein [bacterium]
MNMICHYEIPSTDFDKSKAFYEGLFGWPIQVMPDMGYMMFGEAGQGVGGGFNKVETVNNEGIQVYIEVEDIDASLAKAKEIGGAVVMAKTEIPGHGFMAFVTDTCGVKIGLWSKD